MYDYGSIYIIPLYNEYWFRAVSVKPTLIFPAQTLTYKTQWLFGINELSNPEKDRKVTIF